MYSTKVVVVCILLARVIVESMHNIIIIMQNMLLNIGVLQEFALQQPLSVYSSSWCRSCRCSDLLLFDFTSITYVIM